MYNVDNAKKNGFLLALPTQAITGTVTSDPIDMNKVLYSTGYLKVTTGTVTTADADNYIKFTVEQCETSNGTYEAIADDYWSPGVEIAADTPWDRKINDAAWDNKIFQVSFINKYRYIKVIATETGAFDGTITAEIGYTPKVEPVKYDYS
jgi:hypothetical protein